MKKVKTTKTAQEIFDKMLFETAVETCFEIKTRTEQEQEMLKSYDIPFIKKNGLNIPTLHEMFEDENEAMWKTITENNDDLFQLESDFILPDKESRRKTRNVNRKHKKYNVRGNEYAMYGKEKKVGHDCHNQRIYNNGYGIKRNYKKSIREELLIIEKEQISEVLRYPLNCLNKECWKEWEQEDFDKWENNISYWFISHGDDSFEPMILKTYSDLYEYAYEIEDSLFGDLDEDYQYDILHHTHIEGPYNTLTELFENIWKVYYTRKIKIIESFND